VNTNQVVPAAEVAVDPAAFRHVVGHFASGVTVITTVVDGEYYGTTASAVSSLSMEPPMMLACLNRSSSTHDAVLKAGVFGINILAENQSDLAMKFGRKGGDKFDGVPVTLSAEGVPMLDGALASIVCRVEETPTGGTHTVFLGVATDASARAGEPLAYFRGAFGRLERVKEIAAYDAVRDWVLGRRTPLGSTLDPVEIAAQAKSDPHNVHNALVKLTAESLVIRGDKGEFLSAPITRELTDSVYDGRLTIELGVLASHFDKFSEEDVAELSRLTEELARLRQGGKDELDGFLKTNAKYHNRLVSVAGSAQLTDAFRRLGIGTVWREALNSEEWARKMDHSHIVELTAALKDGDQARAAEALRLHTEFGKELASDVIARHGGAV
jgi:flavin reductase (DIM6/NTAB) family NADH-FMN oxidoreductase RutF/DNA-binding GntR family transcriptional regulator